MPSGFSTTTRAAPYSRASRALDLAAEQVRDELEAVADAEDGHAELEERGSTVGAPSP